jgi:Ca2+-transporting ATPase
MLHRKNHSKPVISTRDVISKTPDRFYYITHSFVSLLGKVSHAVKSIYHAVQSNLGLDQFNLQSIKELGQPLFYTTVSYVIGDSLIQTQTRSFDDDNKYAFQFFLASSFLLYSATHNIAQTRVHSMVGSSLATAADLLAISYTYSSSFQGSQELLSKHITESQSLVVSLGVSAIAIPVVITSVGYHYQKNKVKKLREKGAQISDTATISNGLTKTSNFYFQLYHYLTPELFTLSRLFQLFLISENILHADHFIQQYRNMPAIIIDIWPSIIKRLKLESKKLTKDYEFNTTEEKVLLINPNKPFSFFKNIQRKDLRTSHLVFIRKELDLHSFPLSGEIEVYRADEEKKYSTTQKPAKIRINYKAKNGEDNWQLFKLPKPKNHLTHISLGHIKKDQQSGVLRGVKIDLNGEDNVFVRIKPEEEVLQSSVHEKKSVINQIINRFKSNNVGLAIIGAFLMASWIERQNVNNIPFSMMALLLNLFQMMIPFSENFLRDMINVNLMNEINKSLPDQPMETIDALCVTDFFNTVAGYYSDIFPAGAAIVSDKTGTLTTSKMEALGFWVKGMPNDAQLSLEKESKEGYIPPSSEQQMVCFDVFACAFQNSKPELELEEFAIFDFFKKVFNNENCLSIERVKDNHLKKTLLLGDKKLHIETRHLGLYRSLGGRFTLVNDHNDKYYLVYCGIPKAQYFSNTSLFKTYFSMKIREGVLSRDWSLARAKISNETFNHLMKYFDDENENALEKALSDFSILSALEHYGTFIINNPVKAEADKFISNCDKMGIPVFVATGDTAKASENIARVLYGEKAKRIISISSHEEFKDEQDFASNATVIFVGINQRILALFNKILNQPAKERSMVIFSEMSTLGKGLLVEHLKSKGFFVVANGDGTNDKEMMRKAHFVIGHVGDDSRLISEIEPFVHLTDQQLQRLLHSEQSFYQLFDIHQPRSLFIDQFSRLSNSQEKPSMALILKSAKMSFEFMRALGYKDVIEMPLQHFSSIAFDLGFLGITFNRIQAYSDLPADNQHLAKSFFPKELMVGTVAFGCLTALLRYATSGEAVNWDTMGYWLICLPILENIIFSSFKSVQNELVLAHPNFNESEINESHGFLCFFNKKKKREVKEPEIQVVNQNNSKKTY